MNPGGLSTWQDLPLPQDASLPGVDLWVHAAFITVYIFIYIHFEKHVSPRCYDDHDVHTMIWILYFTLQLPLT